MDKREKGKLERVLRAYFKEIHKIYTGGNFREESFYPALKELFEECSKLFQEQVGTSALVLPKKTEIGIPDFRIGKNGEIIGHIEAKVPDSNLREIEDSEQLKRYRDYEPNFILTNFLEFRLYRYGNLIDKVEVGRQFTLQSLKQPPTPEKLELFFDLLHKFFSFSVPKIKKSSDLAIQLAKRARFLEGILQEELSGENEEVTRFYKAFRQELIETLTEERFADLYAQTITYGLFAARMKVDLPAPRPGIFFVYAIKCEDGSVYIGHTDNLQRRWREHLDGRVQWTRSHRPKVIIHYEEFASREAALKREKNLKTGFGRKWLKDLIYSGRARQAGNGFKRETAWKFIPESLPLLKEIFYSMTGPHFPESLSWVVDDITRVLDKVDMSSILKEFKTTRWEEDPVIHFYETFLATYNPEERERLGVYYTPLPVVSYIVRSIHHLLKDKFSKAEGLATNDVTLLDPAAGTLTFVVQAIKQVQKELEERKKQGLITSYIAEHIIPHFHAFEILVAPYTVGHFKVSRILEEMSYRFKEGERFQFYLTNTLEMKEPEQRSFLIDLAKEGQEAKRIKEEVPILIVLGNPPYSFKSVKSKFIDELMKTYKEDVRTEKKFGVLEDDYIKFIRFGHWKIEQAGKGILGFITNNSYLSGVIHRGMRRKLLETFDEIYVLNLHGSSRIGEKTPEGGKDENVFDIQQGVAIALYVKLEESTKEKKVYYADLWGLRENKYKQLFANDVQTTKWQKLNPVASYYFFIPKDFTLQKEYEKFWKVTEIFKEWLSGVETKRDHFVIGFTKEEITQRLRILTGELPDELVKETLKLKDIREWRIKEVRERVTGKELEKELRPYAYRPFGGRWICYASSLIARDRRKLMKHLLKENIALATVRMLSTEHFRHAFVSDTVGDCCYVSIKTREFNYFFPLYLYRQKEDEKRKSKGTVMMVFEPEARYETREPNFSPQFRKALVSRYKKEPAPEEIFYYIYAVLYSPFYRKRYEEFLKIDFPRIPLPSNYEIFKKLSKLGKELVDLHLLKSSTLDETEIGFPKSGSNTVEKVSYDEATQRVFINKEQYFEGVSKEVWEYRIGVYQVMEKYLKDRKKRKLSLDEINHYMKVAKAIRLTIDLQQKIDKVYKEIKV